MRIIIITSIVFAALLASCKKDDECIGAKIVVTNVGEKQITIPIDDGNIGILPGETASFHLPKDVYQSSNKYFIEGDSKLYSFVTQADACETVEVSLP